VGGVWLGRILHTQMSTTSIVETKVSSGVAEIINRLTDQGGRLHEVRTMFCVRADLYAACKF